MKKNVQVTICGIHTNAQEDSIEVVSVGEMEQKQGQICITYEEAADEEAGVDCEIVTSMLKIKGNQVEMIKRGAAQTHMVFIEGKDTISYYSTAFGELEVAVHTTRLEMKEMQNGFSIDLEYGLEVNSAHMSACRVEIKIEWIER